MIDVAMTRADLRPADVAVVIDVLRATSTATQALASGYRRVLCAESIERARDLRGDRRVLAGEVACVKPDGFDQGNSPVDASQRLGDELVLATTNGAPTIVAAAGHARSVLLACLLNFDAVVTALRQRAGLASSQLQLVCSGTNRQVALEDLYLAGRLSAVLAGPRTDAALVAEAVARAFGSALDALNASADAGVLRAEGLTADIAYCALESELDCVPTVLTASAGVAVVVGGGEASRGLALQAAVDGGDTVGP